MVRAQPEGGTRTCSSRGASVAHHLHLGYANMAGVTGIFVGLGVTFY